MKRQVYCHSLIKKTAQEIAGAAYEQLAQDDTFFKIWPNQKDFINKNWSAFIKETRRVLATMLADPNFNEVAKADIADALIKDAQLPGNQGAQIQSGFRG